MKSSLLHELANVARAQADDILQPYAWPPRGPLSAEEDREQRRLEALCRAIRYRAYCAEYEEQEDAREATRRFRARARAWLATKIVVAFVPGPPRSTDLNFVPRVFGRYASGVSGAETPRAVLANARTLKEIPR